MGPERSSGSIKDAAIDFSAGSLGILKILTQHIHYVQKFPQMRKLSFPDLRKHAGGS
jgi:hypothetical protein